MGISQYIKEIGRGARGAKALTRAQAADLFGQVLDGQVTDLEIGAFCLAMRIKGETAEEMCGFLDAVQARGAVFPGTPTPTPFSVRGEELLPPSPLAGLPYAHIFSKSTGPAPSPPAPPPQGGRGAEVPLPLWERGWGEGARDARDLCAYGSLTGEVSGVKGCATRITDVHTIAREGRGAGGEGERMRQPPLIVLPSYNGARKLPVLTPLLALLLAREGLPVLLHGMRTEARRVLASDVLQALDIPALPTPQAIAAGRVAHIHTHVLHPGLARLLAVREVIGLRNPGHSVVKLLTPCAGPTLLVTSYTHPEYVDMLHATFTARAMNVLLSRGLEGEVAADPRRTPRYDAFIQGQHQVLQEQQAGTAREVSGLPTAIDVETTAAYTRRVLAEDLPVPEALRQQVQHIVACCQHISAGAGV